jgi:hypothetical protein
MLTVHGDGDEVRNDFAPKANQPALFNGAGSRESILYKPHTATTEIKLLITVWWQEAAAVPVGANPFVRLGPSTVREEWQLAMAGKDADLATSPPEDMAMATGMDAQKDAPPQNMLEDGWMPGDKCPSDGGGTCDCISHSNGHDGGTWRDCYAENSTEPAKEACRRYNNGMPCGEYTCFYNGSISLTCPGFSDGTLANSRRWCAKTPSYSGVNVLVAISASACDNTTAVWK